MEGLVLHFCESVCAIVRVVATGVKVTVVNAAAGFPASFFGLAFLVAVTVEGLILRQLWLRQL